MVKASGTDATKQFNAFHSPAVLDKYGPKFLIGEIGTGAEEESKSANEEEEEEERSPLQIGETFGEMVPYGDPMW